MLTLTCPTCGQRVQGDDAFAGKHVLCPGCNATFTVPAATSATAITDNPPLPPYVGTDDRPSNDDLPMPPLKKAVPHIMIRWIPILIVTAVLLTGVCLLMPVTGRVREAPVRTQSTNNLKQIGLAMHSFHDNHKRMPFNGTVPAAADDPTSGSWAFQLLPYCDHQALFHQLAKDVGVSTYMCPGRTRPSHCTTGAWTDYCINPWINDPQNGAANAQDANRTLGKITDGTSNTIFAGHGSVDKDLYGSNVAIAQSTDIFKGGNPALARASTTNRRDEAGKRELTWGGPFPIGALMCMCDSTVKQFGYANFTGGVIRNGVADGGLAVFLTPAGNEVAILPD